MTIQEINKLKKGDKIKINAFHYRMGRIKGTRIITEVYNHTDPSTHGHPHLSVNRICVKCFGWDEFRLDTKEIIEKMETA
jgi:hypothetical protein